MKTSTILSIWAVVVITCVSSAAIAMATMHNAGHQWKSGIMAFAGGGILAMTLEAVVPEAYSETHHWVSILGAAGFTIAFYLGFALHKKSPEEIMATTVFDEIKMNLGSVGEAHLLFHALKAAHQAACSPML